MPRYCIDIGNSVEEPLGFSAEVEAPSEAEAIAKLRKTIVGRLGEEIDKGVVKLDLVDDGEIRYVHLYVNTNHLNPAQITDVLED